MKKRIILGLLVGLAAVWLSGLAMGEEPTVKVGNFVEFGSYGGARILWQVVATDAGHPVLWSENILCAKCFDAAESGKVGGGKNPAEGWGSNLWSKSNLRQWLNTVGKVNWTTQPPVAAAIQGKNHYENEPGFLTGFTPAERSRLVKTTRVIIGYNYHKVVETTSDLVFLPTEEEIGFGGTWQLPSYAHDKYPSPGAVALNAAVTDGFRKDAPFHYFTQTPDDSSPYMVRGTNVGSGMTVYGANESRMGIVPALQIDTPPIKSGDGSRKNPWRFD